LRLDPAAAPQSEGYRLEVSASGATIVGRDAAGAFYGVQTLRQLIATQNGRPALPYCTLRDWPAFSMRGFMHDTGRNFQEIAALKAQMDRLAAYKLNTFHWHLTDRPAWRPQSRLFPQLNDAKYRKAGRDPEKSYSFAEIRDLVRYAADRHIRVIPELDVPGHSDYFDAAFDFKMASPQGMAVLEKLIDEFCAEIPAADCPVLHLGSDEIHISNPQEFMKRMAARVRLNGRTPMVWNPGLVGDSGTIEQYWGDDGYTAIDRPRRGPLVDSTFCYLNTGDALGDVQRYFFHQACRRPAGDDRALGGILCCWPDVRVDDKRKIFLHSPVWPGVLSFAEAVWCGRLAHGGEYLASLPLEGTQAWSYFHEFETRLAVHRDRFFGDEPFPFVRFSQVPWRIVGPFARDGKLPGDHAFEPERVIRETYLDGARTLAWQAVSGGVVDFASRTGAGTMYSSSAAKASPSTMYALTYIHCDAPGTLHAWIGFENPDRASRECGGIPPAGKWCGHGGAVFVNDRPLPAPAWKHPGTQRYLEPTWFLPANEVPYDDEQFYWSRPPVAVSLAAGWNKILFRVPCAYGGQQWTAAFVPVRQGPHGRWIEDLAVKFSVRP
jgi:hypothetical protein